MATDYNPEALAVKWHRPIHVFREQCQALWEAGRPKKRWFSLRDPEPDLAADKMTPRSDRLILAYHGQVVLGHFARAFFPAYIPGKKTHYGSVVYSRELADCSSVFDLAWRVNQLRRDNSPPPPKTEAVARAIRDDRSSFAVIHLPPALGTRPGSCFGNICIQRSRLPLGYLHTRLVPILIQPDMTDWCTLLPLRFWSQDFIDIWRSGPPIYPPEPIIEQCRKFRVKP